MGISVCIQGYYFGIYIICEIFKILFYGIYVIGERVVLKLKFGIYIDLNMERWMDFKLDQLVILCFIIVV